MLTFIFITLFIVTKTAILPVAGFVEGSFTAAGVWIVQTAATSGVSSWWGGDLFFTATCSDQGEGADQGEKEKGVQGLFFHDLHCK